MGLTLSVLYGELNLRRPGSKLLMVAMAVFLALFANWLRVFVIIYMGYLTEMETGLIDDHNAFGWWVFAATLLPLFLFGRWLEKRPAERNDSLSAPAPKVKTPALSGLLSVAGLFLLTTVLLVTETDTTIGKTQNMDLSLKPGQFWSPLFQRQLLSWQPQVQKPDWVYQGTFFNAEGMEAGDEPDMTALISLSTYEFQREGREVVQYGNRLYDNRVWHPMDGYVVTMENGNQLQGLTLGMRGSEETIELVYGYYVQGRWETDRLLAKIAQLYGFFNARNDASLMAIGVHCNRCDSKQAARDLARKVQPMLQQALDQKFAPTQSLSHSE